jgi:hypothetical protein
MLFEREPKEDADNCSIGVAELCVFPAKGKYLDMAIFSTPEFYISL